MLNHLKNVNPCGELPVMQPSRISLSKSLEYVNTCSSMLVPLPFPTCFLEPPPLEEFSKYVQLWLGMILCFVKYLHL